MARATLGLPFPGGVPGIGEAGRGGTRASASLPLPAPLPALPRPLSPQSKSSAAPCVALDKSLAVSGPHPWAPPTPPLNPLGMHSRCFWNTRWSQSPSLTWAQVGPGLAWVGWSGGLPWPGGRQARPSAWHQCVLCPATPAVGGSLSPAELGILAGGPEARSPQVAVARQYSGLPQAPCTALPFRSQDGALSRPPRLSKGGSCPQSAKKQGPSCQEGPCRVCPAHTACWVSWAFSDDHAVAGPGLTLLRG